MAVDSRQKRASAASALVISRPPGMDNTSLNSPQRIASAWSYAGITLTTGGAAGSLVIFEPPLRRRRRL